MDCNLKSQQIELGLLVAARFLLPHSNVLSSLLPQSKSKDGGLYNSWLIEELFNAALKSNSVKSIYQRNEIEVGLVNYLIFVARGCNFSSIFLNLSLQLHISPSVCLLCIFFHLSFILLMHPRMGPKRLPDFSIM